MESKSEFKKWDKETDKYRNMYSTACHSMEGCTIINLWIRYLSGKLFFMFPDCFD